LVLVLVLVLGEALLVGVVLEEAVQLAVAQEP